jgi:hypothetical protein
LRDTGEGSVYGRADSRFLWVTYRHGGKTINKSTKTADPRKARKVLRELLVKRDAGDRAPESRMVTVGELRDMFMADLAANERRAPDRAERAAAHVVAYFGEATLARAIDAGDVSAFVAKRREDAENSTVNRELAALRRMLRLGVLSGKLERRPEVPMLADSAARKGFLERAQIEAVLEHLESDFRAAVVVDDDCAVYLVVVSVDYLHRYGEDQLARRACPIADAHRHVQRSARGDEGRPSQRGNLI